MASLTTELDAGYRKVGAFDADVLYVYTDFRHYGMHLQEFPDRNAFCNAFVDPFLRAGKTVLLTTFTYTTEGEYHVDKTSTKLGVMNKWILSQQERQRSEHPLFSFAAMGPQAAALVKGVGKSAFGFDSVYDRLYGRRAAFLHVGRPVSMGNTALHYVEQRCGATYRLHKGFQTKVYERGKYIGTDYTAFLRRRDVDGQNFEFAFDYASRQMSEAGLIREVGSSENCSNISFYRYDETLELLCRLFYEKQDVFLHGPFMQY